MRKAIVILLAVMMLNTSGCYKDVIEHNYTFKGENECWDVKYTVDATEIFTKKKNILGYDCNSDKLFTIAYKKELSDLSSIKNLKVSYKSHAESGSISEEYNDGPPTEKTYTIKTGGKGRAIEGKDEVIKVTIDIDGNIQTINLKNVN